MAKIGINLSEGNVNKEEKKEIIIGIDLGTTNSLVAYSKDGEPITVKGKNPKNESWKIGIDQPVENSSPGFNEFQLIVSLKNQSLATSGNYRKFYEKDGVKYSHTIDPKTGYPVQHSLLSVTVIHEQAAFADAYATAFMVMGVDVAKAFIENNSHLGIDAYFIYSDKKGENQVWMSSGMQAYIVD